MPRGLRFCPVGSGESLNFVQGHDWERQAVVGRVPETGASPGRGRPGGLVLRQLLVFRVRGGRKPPGCSAATEAKAEDAHGARVSARLLHPRPPRGQRPLVRVDPRPPTPSSPGPCSSPWGARTVEVVLSPRHKDGYAFPSMMLFSALTPAALAQNSPVG